MSLKDWSTTAGSNTASPPNGAPEGMTIANVNNTVRQIMADARTLAAEDSIASATTCDLGTKDATFLTVSGTITITGFGTVSAGIYKFVKFSGVLTLTHNATVAGDCGLYKSEGSGNWREYFYSGQNDYQPLDAQLTTLAGITAQQATDLASLSTFMGTVLNDADAATARATLAITNQTIASTAEAQAGTDNTNMITPLRMREGFNAAGTAPVYACRAWVNFNGAGVVSIRASGNVSSITDNGVGNYTVNFGVSLPDANYSAPTSSRGMDSVGNPADVNSTICSTGVKASESVGIFIKNPSNTLIDSSEISVSVFR